MAVPLHGWILGPVQQQQDAQGPYVTRSLAHLISLGSECYCGPCHSHDWPTASKVGGFTSHSHQMFYPHDMVPKKDLCIATCFKKDGEGFIEISIIRPNMVHL
jgi:hypothetical protein